MNTEASLLKMWEPEKLKVQFKLQSAGKSENKKAMDLDFFGVAFSQAKESEKLKVLSQFNPDPKNIFFSQKIEKFLKNQNDSLAAQKKHARGEFGQDRFSCFCLESGFGKSQHALIALRDNENFDWAEGLRAHWGAPLKSYIQKEGEKSALIDLSYLSKELQKFVLENLAALTEILFWDFPKYTQSSEAPAKKDKKPEALTQIAVRAPKITPAEFKTLTHQGQMWGKANNFVRTAAERAANDLDPLKYRNEIAELCKKQKISFEFWGEKDLLKKQAGGFMAVAQAHDGKGENGIVRLSIKAKGNKKAKTLSLVGKGLCFDTGGYNIKTGNYMWGMQKDMTGSAVALASLLMMQALEVSHNVVAYLALCDNLVSTTAYKPNEVIKTAKGITVEIVNTDAEGRMVLSDTLFFASSEKPDLIIDFATLTGSAIYALDTFGSLAFTNKFGLHRKIIESSDTCGERVWTLPLGSTWENNLKSDIADIRQCKVTGKADAIYAATFLNQFVDTEVTWVHVDLACAENPGGLGLVASETTGFGPRLALQLSQDLI